MTKTFSENGEALLTRRGAVEHIKNTRGIPLTLAAVNKFAMQGRGPKPDRYYGRRELGRAMSLGSPWIRFPLPAMIECLTGSDSPAGS